MKNCLWVALVAVIIIASSLFYLNREPDVEKVYKIGVVLDGRSNDRSWNQSHYEGIIAAVDELKKTKKVDLIIREQVLQDETCIPIMEDMINQGCGLIIAGSYNYGPFLRKLADKHPEVKFIHSGGDIATKNISTCFGRMYQMRYLSGIVAGLQTKTNKIGYVAAFPIPEVNRGINAFTLGVKRANPDATVYVNWSYSWESGIQNIYATEKILEKENIDVLTVHTNSTEPLKIAEKKGIWTIGYHYDNNDLFPKTYLTAPVWDWQQIYKTIVYRAVLGRLPANRNYWEGVETGVVKLATLTKNVKEGTSVFLHKEHERLESGRFDVFYGPIKDNKGNLRVKIGQNITDKYLLEKFDWYVEGVVNID